MSESWARAAGAWAARCCGALALACLLWPGPSQAQGSPPFTAATWNLRLDTSSDGPNAWPHRRDAVRALIRWHGFDLLGTQEAMAHQVDDLEALTEFGRTGVGRDDGARGGEFAAIFYRRSRFALQAEGTFWLSPTPDQPSMGWDARCCKRIASWARLQDRASGRSFFVLSAHFDHEGVVARRESARLLLRQMATLAAGLPIVCMGDFNTTPGTEPIQLMTAQLADARAASATAPYGPVGTFNDFKLDAPLLDRIDYVFVSPGVRVLKYGVLSDSVDRRYPSDHHPVVVQLQID